MSERKFIKNLTKPGSAAVLRENVSAAVRHSTLMVRPNISEPIDYESFVSKYREILQNDPQRELLLFPMNDFTVKIIKNIQKTTKVYRKINFLKNDSLPLYIQECLNFFTKDLHFIIFQYGFFSGSWSELPKFCKVKDQVNLTDQIYDQDEEELIENEDDYYDLNLNVGIAKEGYILKGPDSGTDSLKSLTTKSYKRRWMSLRQEIDGSFMLEFHKDNKKMESKGAICLDFCSQLIKHNSKKTKFVFELRLTEGQKSCFLATETEFDFNLWIDVINKAIQSKNEIFNKKNSNSQEESNNSPVIPKFGTLRNVGMLKNTELTKISQENDYIISEQRKENRLNLFSVYPDLYLRKGSFLNLSLNYDYQPSPYNQNFSFRFKFSCKSIDFNLKTTIEGTTCLAEPLFTSVAIYDIKKGKITEEFRFDMNDAIKEILPKNSNNDDKEKTDAEFTNEWILNPKEAIFSVNDPNTDMYLVIRIEKIFSGGITSTSEAYLKSIQNGYKSKLGNKLHKSAKATCQKMTSLYRMPFAWAAKPLFKDNISLDTNTDFGQIYRQDSNKLSDEDLIKHLIELKNTEKLKNITLIPGKIKISLEEYPLFKKLDSQNNLNSQNILNQDLEANDNKKLEQKSNIVNSSHIPVLPFETPVSDFATIEIEEFLNNEPKNSYPFTSFINLLYVFPKFLKYDVQKLFPKAKNICCTIEFRDSDAEDSVPLKIIYGSPGRNDQEFVSKVNTAVTYHNNNPEFYEEVKIALPTILNEKQHILFSFYHVSSSSLSNKKKEGTIETPIGYSWIQIYPTKGKLAIDDVFLPISSHLPSGYLSYKPLGLGHGFSGPDIKWIDNGRELFKVDFKLVSNIFPTDYQLHLFFVQCDKMLDIKSSTEDLLETSSNSESFNLSSDVKRMSMCSEAGREISKFVQIQHGMPKILKSLEQTKISDLVRFFPVLTTQLLKLLVTTTSCDVAQHIVKTLTFILGALEVVNKKIIVENYIEYYFSTSLFKDLSAKTTLHEELILSLVNILKTNNSDQPATNKLLAHSWFFFKICTKSMICYLNETQRIKMHRNERFSTEFHDSLATFIDLFTPEIMKKHNILPKETRSANSALSHFLVRMFAIMDRGFIFKLIKLYLDKFHAAKDSLPLISYKFEFLAIVTSYEHYIPLNLPLNFNQLAKNSSFDSNFRENSIYISDDFCKNHFLIGVLLQEVKSALSEVNQVRTMAISVLRNLLVKHSIDERYQSKYQLSKISSLYFPFFSIMLENISRFQISGYSDSFILSINNAILNSSKNYAGMTSMNGSMYSLNTIESGTGTIRSYKYNPKRVSFTEKFNSLNNDTSKALVSSLKRNSSLESAFNNSENKTSEDSLSLISGSASLNGKNNYALSNNLNKRKSLDEIDNKNNFNNENRSDSPYSSSSSTTTLTANQYLNDKQSSTETLMAYHLPPQHNSSSITNHSSHQRNHSLPVRFDKLNNKEIRDLLIIFLWINKNLNEEFMVEWLKQADNFQLMQMLTLLEICLYEFKYTSKKNQNNSNKNKSQTLPIKSSPNLKFSSLNSSSPKNKRIEMSKLENLETDNIVSTLLEANLTTECGLIVLDFIGIITNYLYLRLLENEGDNQLMKKIFSVFLTYFRFKQSDKLLTHLFASLRLYVQKFSAFLFSGSSEHIGKLCLELLKFCSSRISSVRGDASILLYLLLKANFNYTKQTAITRMHLQLIISISQLLGDSNINLINNCRFHESLSMINNYALTDKSVQKTKFSFLIKDLVKNIRTYISSSVLMSQHEDDPEKLLDLQHNLANSYRETSPALRRTWLHSMSKNHVKNGNYSEAAHCLAHACALEFECLRIKDKNLFGSKDFEKISINIVLDEKPIAESVLNKDIYSSTEQQFSEELLIKNLQTTVEMFVKSDRFEVVPEVYRLLIPLFEKKRDYETLVKIHKDISENYQKIINLQKSGKRFLGRYYKVSFFGRDYFDDDSGIEFIYKEEKVTSLSEISQRLKEQYGKKHGLQKIKLIQNEKEIDEDRDCDPNFGYIQIVHVVPCEVEQTTNNYKPSLFDKVNNINKFMFETPFCMSDENKSRSVDCEDQAKKRTICITEHQFPYLEKRIKVENKQVQIFTPIEVAIDEMHARVKELQEVIHSEQPDVKKLHLKLGGSISVQVNAGPLAYAKAFINKRYPSDLVYQLKVIFKEFVDICELGIQLNEKLVSQEQYQYHESLKENLQSMVQQLSTLCLDDYNVEDKIDFESTISNKSFKIFDYISGSNA